METPRKQAQAGLGAEAPIKKISHQPADPAVVALRMEDLTVWVIERVAKMPRDHKFTVGDKLRDMSASDHTPDRSELCARQNGAAGGGFAGAYASAGAGSDCPAAGSACGLPARVFFRPEPGDRKDARGLDTRSANTVGSLRLLRESSDEDDPKTRPRCFRDNALCAADRGTTTIHRTRARPTATGTRR